MRIVVYLIACLSLLPALAAQGEELSFNSGWKFHLGEVSGAGYAEFDDAKWPQVRLPHTPRIEALVMDEAGPDTSQWQGICWYRKRFNLTPQTADKTVLLEVGAAMRVADIWINGQFVGRRSGGYLPVVFDITPLLRADGENIVAIRLDNYDNPVTGPKPLALLDFNFYGGLYRGAELIVKDRLHITHPTLADKPASGGVFVTFPEVSPERAVLRIRTHVQNDYAAAKDARVRTAVVAADGQTVAESESGARSVAAGKDSEFVAEVELDKPRLWSTEEPNLYTVRSELVLDGQVVDRQETRVGVRDLLITNNGLWLNGKKTFLRGTNRHQEYPYVGYALSDNAQYRDAKKIKDAGFDYVRLSHYPQSPAFLAACDELGILVMNSIMGWQYSSTADEFVAQQQRQCRDLIRRDRNHPSVFLWEVSLNESAMSREFIESLQSIAHEEYPGERFYTCGWTSDFDVYLEARQHGGCRKVTDKPCVVSEYGDWEYYAQNAGLDQDAWRDLSPAERTSRQSRADGELRMLQQSRNFQEAHNDNRKTTAFADGLWVMYDYNRGYSDDLETSGCMDIFRLPKFSYYFYQSQRDAAEKLPQAASGPMVFIANYWTPESPGRVRVFSNCEQVSLYLNDKLVGTQFPDDDQFSSHLAHPPFSFDLSAVETGALRAVGTIGGVGVAEHARVTPGLPTQLAVNVDLSGRPLACDQNDLVFVHATVTDADGTPVPNDGREVLFEVEGPGELIGDNPARAAAGIASILLRGGQAPGTIRVKAAADELASDLEVVELVETKQGAQL